MKKELWFYSYIVTGKSEKVSVGSGTITLDMPVDLVVIYETFREYIEQDINQKVIILSINKLGIVNIEE